MGTISNVIMLDKLPMLEHVIHDVLMREAEEIDKATRISISSEIVAEMREHYPNVVIDNREYALIPLKGEPTWLTD